VLGARRLLYADRGARSYLRIDRMAVLEPLFVDVTWTTAGEGRDSREATFSVCEYARKYAGLVPMIHITLTGMTREELVGQLDRAKRAGIRNVLALRGDPPKGKLVWEPCPGGLSRAEELVRLIREHFKDWFCVAVAGFPEGYAEPGVAGGGDHAEHVEASADPAVAARKTASREAAVAAVVAKVAAGADMVMTQCLYSAEAYASFVKECRASGVPASVPILPGVLPVHSYDAFRRMTAYTGVSVPADLEAALSEAAASDEDDAVFLAGQAFTARLCSDLLKAGAPGLHFYTLNLERATRELLKSVGLATGSEARKLPWRPSGVVGREGEQVRPIFWANRPRSYVERTHGWEGYPSGRWGDAVNPSFSDTHFSAPGAGLGSAEARRAIWGDAESLVSDKDVCEVFARYLEGSVPQLPWCDQPLLSETSPIRERLVALNRHGFCTINSQPRVNGARSDDPVVGWGGRERFGYVYQKAYIECFCAPKRLASFIKAVETHPSITFTAVDQQGNVYTNNKRRGEQAVTWGVFPGKEVLQPTVVDDDAFMAWKDEAFHLWGSVWASAYADDSSAAGLLTDIQSKWFLLHAVDHNFVSGDIFQVFEDAAAPQRE
jgi:methylenetetrahydrofolate reductase (NADPH)